MVEQRNSAANTKLTGPLLRLAQFGWLVIVVLVIGLQIVGLPALYRQLSTVCDQPVTACEELGQPTAAQAAELSVTGISLTQYAAFMTGVEMLLLLIWTGTGVLIFVLRSDDWMALLVSLMLIVFSSATFISGTLSAAAVAHPPLAGVIAALAILGEGLIVAFFLLFPNGRMVPRWLWWLIPLRLVAALLDYVPAFVAHPASEWLSTLLLLPVIPVMLAAQVFRYRRVSTARERSQTRWVLFGVLGGLGTFLMMMVVTLVTGFWQSTWSILLWSGMNVVATLIPITFAIAMLRSNLWDVDVVIRRTTVYAVLTALLALVYFGSILVLQNLFGRVTGQNSTAAVVLSTLLIAALFLPLRRRVQGLIDRRFYRRKYDAEQVLSRFAATVRDETDLDALTAELVRVIEETMQPERVTVWLRPESQRRGTSKSEMDAVGGTVRLGGD